MSQMGGGLRWHGVSKTGSTATSRIMNAAKAEREKANRSAPKVGSASVTDSDDWLAVAAAERAARERTGATGNAFADGASLVREAKRQATSDDDEFAIPSETKRAASTTTPARRRQRNQQQRWNCQGKRSARSSCRSWN